MNIWILAMTLASFSTVSVAESTPSRSYSGDPIGLLQRVADTAMSLSYSGVFIYRSGDHEETSRIARTNFDGREVERIEVLDGSAREVMRSGAEVKCFLPSQNRLIVEQQSAVQGFPARLGSALADLQQNYLIRAGGLGRVAGNVCQALILTPRDALRYEHRLWVEPSSGLILKAGMVNQKGQVLESFTFTQVNIGPIFARQQLVPSAESQMGKVQRIQTSELHASEMKWAMENLPAGFRIQKVMLRRTEPRQSGQEVVHAVISDGLAAVSVFIEPSTINKVHAVDQQAGAMSVYSRQIGDFRALVMGEVPLITARLIADSIERR